MEAKISSVPYFDSKRQYARLGKEFEEALAKTAASGLYILPPSVQEFEKNFARYCGTSYGIGVGSGTDALIFALKAAGLKKGDEVIAPSFTFVATVFAIMHAGATPVLVDVDPATYTLCPKAVEKAVTRKTRAILPVHLYGQAADMGAIEAIAKKKNLKIIEDACQAHGASWNGRKTGSFGFAGCFSFYPTKNLGAMGDGGMITGSDTEALNFYYRLRNLGRKDLQENHLIAGWTSRLDGMQAAILDIKLKHLDSFNDGRRRAAQTYKKLLAGTPLVLPTEAEGRRHVYHLFVVLAPGGKRDSLQKHLADNGIRTMVHYPVAVHQQPACKSQVRVAGKLKVTESLSGEILSLPMFPEITDEEIAAVASAVKSFYA